MSSEQINLWASAEEPRREPREESAQLGLFGPVEAEAPVEIGEAAQLALLEVGEWWETYWKGMPEFIQKDLEPFKTIYVHFETRADMKAFAELVGQQIGLNTRSIWYPEAEIGHFADRRYIDAPPPEEDDDVEIFEDGPDRSGAR